MLAKLRINRSATEGQPSLVNCKMFFSVHFPRNRLRYANTSKTAPHLVDLAVGGDVLKLLFVKVSMAISDSSSSFENNLPFAGLSKEMLGDLLEDSEIWHNLKQAIAASSGFQRWQIERDTDGRLNGLNQDTLVRNYLRETLETLAY